MKAAMPTPLPFAVTPEAEQWLLQVSDVPNKQPGIFRTFRYEIHKDGELAEEFDGEHYSVGYDLPEGWASEPSAIRVTIAHRDFWLPPDTVNALRSKTLSVVQRAVGRGRYAGRIRNVLVAV